MLTNSKQDEKIRYISFKLFKLNQKFKEQEQKYKAEREKLQSEIFKYTNKKGIQSYDFQNGDTGLKFTTVKTKKLVFDLDKLKKKLDKELLSEVIKKEYTIKDMDGLIAYLKSCGVDPKKFKSFIDSNETVDEKKINELSEFGEILMDDLEGCYEVKFGTPYVKITDWKIEEAEE